MKHSKLLSLLLAIVLTLSLAAPALAAEGETEEAILTRGEFVTALYKLTDEWDVSPAQDYFDDVPAEGGLAQIVRWAVENGIVNGYGNRKFGPDDPVTREQMAAMLYRNAQKLGQGFQGMWMFPLDYPDAAEVSAWADEAMHWVVMEGIIVGTDRGLEPKALATDDQLSLVLQRWQKSMIEAEDRVWYSFDDVALAMQVPADMEFKDFGDWFLGRNGRLMIDLSRWDQIGGPAIEDLCALAAASTMEPAGVVEQGGMKMVRSDRADREICYFLMAPNGDSWYLWILPDTEAHPELTADDVAAEAEAIAGSLCHSLNIPEGEKAVEMLPAEYPAIDDLVLVNKLNALPEDWEAWLQIVFTVNSMEETVEVERTAYKKYLELKADLEQNDGVYLELDSAWRSVEAQQDIMDRFTEKYGADYAAKTVAQPGYSEHHTGLALDLYFRIRNEDGSFTDVYYNEDLEKEAYRDVWAAIHGKLAQYGFILRYPEGKEHVTGYRYEPWHIRYVGNAEDAFAIMSQPGLTLEEYLAGSSSPELAVDLSGSALYTEEELTDAMLAVKCAFASFEGCELHSIRYGGDAWATEENLRWMNELDEGKDYTQVALFLTDFHSPVEEGPYAWEPDEEYTDYQWWLARSEEGGWQLLDWGYGGALPAEDGQNPVMNFVGQYQSGRAHALVECAEDDKAAVTIDWGDSAWSLMRWEIVGPLDPETRKVEYSGCVKTYLTYNDAGEVESEVVESEDGTGWIVFHEDGTFTWHDDQSEYGEDLVFEWTPTVPEGWSRQGFFQDEEGNILSVTWMDDVTEPGWYVGCMLGETMAGWIVQPEGDTLRGDLNAWDESAQPFIVTVSEEGEDGLMLVVEGGGTYHFTPMELPKATIFVHISTEGVGNIDYAVGETAPEIDEEYPYQSAQINLAEPETYTFTAWTKEDGWGFIKWMKDGEDFSTDPTVTLELAEDGDYTAVFEYIGGDGQNPVMNFIGQYQSGRARATVACEGSDAASVTIEWSDSVSSLMRWEIAGPLDLDTRKVEYAGCVKTYVTYNSDGTLASEELRSEDGTGWIVFHEDGTFTWHDDQSEYGEDLVFEWLPSVD